VPNSLVRYRIRNSEAQPDRCLMIPDEKRTCWDRPSHKSLLRKIFHFSLSLSPFSSPNDNIFISSREGFFFCFVYVKQTIACPLIPDSFPEGVSTPKNRLNSTVRVKHQQSKHHIVSRSQTTTEKISDLQTRRRARLTLREREEKYKKKSFIKLCLRPKPSHGGR
jgi:hypothetical protein